MECRSLRFSLASRGMKPATARRRIRQMGEEIFPPRDRRRKIYCAVSAENFAAAIGNQIGGDVLIAINPDIWRRKT